MLSIGKLALGQHRYYERQTAQGWDDYYAGRGEAPGEWLGAGAAALGLSGRVSGKAFSALLAGCDPREPAVRLRSSVRDPKVAALDLTFSAPKSVSVLAAIGDEQLARALILAHEQAVRAAVDYLEASAVHVRRGYNGARVERGEGLIAAAYRHRMSRALDPQLHTHVVAANLARGPDGRFSALHGAALYRAAKTAGYLYQAHLRSLVTERLGLEWGPVTKGAAELAGVSETVLQEFSKRRKQMQRVALAGGIGLESKAAGQAAALATRERKHYGVETHTWREQVRARAGELGLGTRELQKLLREGREPLVNGRGREAVEERHFGDQLTGAEGLTERANTFDERLVLQKFAQAARAGERVSVLRAQAERFAQRRDVLATRRGEMTTAGLVQCERRLIVAAVSRAGEDTCVLDPRVVERDLLGGGVPLTGEQAAAVRAVVCSGAGVSVIEALAGTGKTFIAGVLRDLYEQAGYVVLGVAPTARAARELSAQAGVVARTLDRLLLDLHELGDELPERCVVILDEAGMAATRPTARLLKAAQDAGAKVVAIGDPGQLSSVQAGGWLSAVAAKLGRVRLSEVMRQSDRGERRALAALHDHRPGSYLTWAEHAGRVETFHEQAHALQRAVAAWARATDRQGVSHAVMIARDNDTRAGLNSAARELWSARGRLADERTYGALALAVGDRVICRRNERAVDVDNGMRGTLCHLDAERVVVRTDSGLTRELPASYVAEHVEHAYALTGHGMQGATVETAIVVASPRDLTAGWSYTALSRARTHTRVLIHAEDCSREPLEHAPTDHLPPPGRAQLLARAQQRMLQRDDEDLATDQLPSAVRANDPHPAVPAHPREVHREQAAVGAKRQRPQRVTRARLQELRERRDELNAQLGALPTRKLQRMDELDARFATLLGQRDDVISQLRELPEPRKQLRRDDGRWRVERVHLNSIRTKLERELESSRSQREWLAHELGDPTAIKAERYALQAALAAVSSEHTEVRNELADLELSAPGAWIEATFSKRPEEGRRQAAWDTGVRAAARYRVDHEIRCENDALGIPPPERQQQEEWHRARREIERSLRRLAREAHSALGVEVELQP